MTVPPASFYSFFQPLIDVLNSVMVWLHDTGGLGWGLAVVVTTVLVRIVILPLTMKQMRSMRDLQTHMPELKKIQEKYKNDRERMQRETMAFYKDNKVNPFGSCLPLLLQMPFFFAMYGLLRGTSFQQDIESSANPGWLFIDSLVENPTGAETVVLIVLMIGSTVGSFLLTPTPSAGNQRYVFLVVFGGMFAFLVPSFPAGLSVYWITTSLWTVGQQLVLRRVIPPPPQATPEEARVAKAPPPPPRKKKRRRR